MDKPFELLQLTGRHLRPGQTQFPDRTPADPVVFVEGATGAAMIYGTQVEGSGLTFLRYPDLKTLLAAGSFARMTREVYLTNGQRLEGREAIWDALRLSYHHLKACFPQLDTFYHEQKIKAASDIYYGGVALNPDGTLGDFPADNWRRRIHAMVEREDGRLEIIAEPVFNPIPANAKTSDYIGFGLLPSLPGNYLGHAYGPNFKIEGGELWMIHEEVSRRALIQGKHVEITEIFARRMLTPLHAEAGSVRLVSVESPDGTMSPDACRGPLLNYTQLLEGFRPTQVDAGGIHLDEAPGREFFFLTGSSGNFAGDDYDVIMAVREGSAIGPYRLITDSDTGRWKRYLRDIKKAHGLSWAGRGSFVQDNDGGWHLLFHAVDKSIKPEGSYTGAIPPNTADYHRNLYLLPLEFFMNETGEPDVCIRNPRITLAPHAASRAPFGKGQDHRPSKL
ncbi:MAG TPA: hypothetical protein VFO10_22435 [Oligoflexus sp.]|uniref:hypothetical protein n=1 Tax=Oligoflexus sp. TaxID=1971216 RepID=UPI002D80E38B|nr:hypothetical protein [Oligoflexus sp.]HET9240037.1 hypothetical protein [Oligoflexus sp.]